MGHTQYEALRLARYGLVHQLEARIREARRAELLAWERVQRIPGSAEAFEAWRRAKRDLAALCPVVSP